MSRTQLPTWRQWALTCAVLAALVGTPAHGAATLGDEPDAPVSGDFQAQFGIYRAWEAIGSRDLTAGELRRIEDLAQAGDPAAQTTLGIAITIGRARTHSREDGLRWL